MIGLQYSTQESEMAMLLGKNGLNYDGLKILKYIKNTIKVDRFKKQRRKNVIPKINPRKIM